MERLIIYWVMLALTSIIVSLAALSAEPENDIKPEFNITTTTVLVHWYDSEQELQLSLGDPNLAGFTECELRPDFNTSFCEMWVVTPIDLKDYYAFDTIGHEFYHTLAGDFHAE